MQLHEYSNMEDMQIFKICKACKICKCAKYANADIQNQIYLINPSKPNCQSKPTKPNLANQTCRTKHAKENLPTQTYQIKPIWICFYRLLKQLTPRHLNLCVFGNDYLSFQPPAIEIPFLKENLAMS